MRVIFKKEQQDILETYKKYEELKEDYSKLERANNENVNLLVKAKHENQLLKSREEMLTDENQYLKSQVEHYKNIISMKNQEENLASIYDEYLYGPKEEKGE